MLVIVSVFLKDTASTEIYTLSLHDALPILSFASGMAGISAALLACAGTGDRVVLPSDGYYATRALAADELARFGVRVEYVSTPDIGKVAARGDLEGARFVLLETPSNPQLDVCDIAAVAAATRAAGAVLARSE